MSEKPKKDVLQPVDEDVRRQAKTFLRTARQGSLATLDPGTGTPMASRVSLASASDGAPVFLISQLSGHFGALEADPRASILLGEPGKGDPLAHRRITVFGRAEKVVADRRALVRWRFLRRHPKSALYAAFGDFAFWRLNVEGASFNGGFGKAYALSADDLAAPADPDLEPMEMGAVEHMNEDHLDAIGLYATDLLGKPEGAWTIACLDLEGLDLTLGDEVARLWFDPPLSSAEELRPRLVELAKRARQT
ncbi:MAG: HugZ family protein [Paracoccaceae bacterium]